MEFFRVMVRGWKRQIRQGKLLGALPMTAFRYEILKKHIRSGEAAYVLEGEGRTQLPLKLVTRRVPT